MIVDKDENEEFLEMGKQADQIRQLAISQQRVRKTREKLLDSSD